MSGDIGGLGSITETPGGPGLHNHSGEPANRHDHIAGDPTAHLSDHPAVLAHGKGVPTADLSSFLEAFADYAISRVEGVGSEQYLVDGSQKFEAYNLHRIVAEALDELADIVSYSSMTAVKLLSLRNRLAPYTDGENVTV